MTARSYRRLAIRSCALVCGLAATVFAQPAPRRATNLQAILAYPAFYQQRPVVIVGRISLEDNGELRISDGSEHVRVVSKGSAPDGLNEVRGELWDVGRMHPDDPQLSGYDLRATFGMDPGASWPRPGQVLAFMASAVTPASLPAAPSIRAAVLFPRRYVDQRVTLTGQFAGRNLLGDLADGPSKSKYDFVLRSADAAIWVSGVRPKGKDFELSLDARIDTGRWLEVTGLLQQGRGLQWLEGEVGTVKIVQAPAATPLEEPIRVAAAPPPEVVFSAPVDDEPDVSPTTSVRIQFSRAIDPASIRGHVRVQYDENGGGSASMPTVLTPTQDFTPKYQAGNFVLEIRFTKPLEHFRAVHVELLDGIVGTDKQPLKPWTLTFRTGG